MISGSAFERLESHLRRSTVVRIVDAIASAWRVAAARSAVIRQVRGAGDRFRSHPAAERLRATGVFVVTATVGHLVLLRFLPSHIAPALPPAIWMLVATAAAIVAIVPDRLVAGWDASFASRVWRATRSRRTAGL
jgi:hypothetical protein